MGGYQAEHSKQGHNCYVDLSHLFSSQIGVPRDSVILFFWVQRGRHLPNRDFSYPCKFLLQKAKFYLIFNSSSASSISYKEQAQDNPYDKEVYFEVVNSAHFK